MKWGSRHVSFAVPPAAFPRGGEGARGKKRSQGLHTRHFALGAPVSP